MLYVHKHPAPPLDAFVESVWLCRNAARPRALERVLPSRGAQLIVNLAEDETRVYQCSTQGVSSRTLLGSILSGIATRFQIIDTDEQENVAGVVFRPGGIQAFTRWPASELSNTDVPVEALWGSQVANRLREQLLAAASPSGALRVLEAWLLEIWHDRTCHPAVSFALDAFHSSPSIARISDITSVISLSPKRFIEKFEVEVGVTPKRYCRLLRFQLAVAKAHCATPRDWTQLALDCGYFDQAHFIHEFREFSGITPSGYAASATSFQNHVTFLQSPEKPLE
jgi:AraC-like DNA-binding protein